MTEIQTHIFRVSLPGEADIYREIEVEGGKPLYDLAEAIVSAFDFDFDHAFGFYTGTKPRTMLRTDPRYELFADMGDSDARSVKKTRIRDAFPAVGSAMTFLYDYGEDWQFRIKLVGLGRKTPKIRYPRVLTSKGEAPVQYDFPEEP
jgi:hypothetical protein